MYMLVCEMCVFVDLFWEDFWRSFNGMVAPAKFFTERCFPCAGSGVCMTLYVCILGKRYTYAIAQLAFALQIILQQTDLILELVQT